ncbi:hypothetical protein [Thalassobius sp. I31.1]|uniref:hypothetical protein n=1 Tax=Thalassobius sp. I31.1 TaxID=2109912 RepID=UPI000D1A5900|nr:hypothetical protein [Thalassobius sp. I31.1]
MSTLWLFDIEPHEQRYTVEWQKYLPLQIRAAMVKSPKPWTLEIVQGSPTTGTTSRGAFLNFAETNAYKACQVAEFSLAVQQRRVKQGDRVVFTDAWHPGVIHVRYMSDLLRLDLSIEVMWHAGSYDWFDFLGRAVKNKQWSYNFERSLFEAADHNFFATKFHRTLFEKVINPRSKKKSRVVGWPMEYLPSVLGHHSARTKKDTILFPHRISGEKQPAILKALAPQLGHFRIVFAQEKALTKAQYHMELARAVVVFSANKQETLGIGVYEAVLCGAVPVVPKRLSYPEMYPGWCYPTAWTQTPKSAAKYADLMVNHIGQAALRRNPSDLAKLSKTVGNQYFNGSKFYASILR